LPTTSVLDVDDVAADDAGLGPDLAIEVDLALGFVTVGVSLFEDFKSDFNCEVSCVLVVTGVDSFGFK